MKKNKIKLFIVLFIIVIGFFSVFYFIFSNPKKNQNEEKKNDNVTENKKEEVPKEKEEEVPKEKVDIIDVNSKTRPLAISINNTPVAVKVQMGLNKAYIVYEIPTEGATSRLLALYKDVDDTKVGTVRSARHNFVDFALESDAIFAAYGWSHYAEDDLKKHSIDYVQGIVGEGKFYRENPEHLASEHTVYGNTNKILDYAYNKKKYKKDSDKTILLNYNVSDVDLSKVEGNKTANKVTIPYGNIKTVFEYNNQTNEYTRIVNGKVATDYKTKEAFTTKNIIIQRLNYSMCDDNYYWDLKTVGSGEGYFVTGGKYVPIKWEKSSRSAKTKYMYLDGKEIEVSDGRTYIEVQVKSKKSTFE